VRHALDAEDTELALAIVDEGLALADTGPDADTLRALRREARER